MISPILRRIACAGAILGLGVASSPRVQAAAAAPVMTASVNSSHTMSTATASAWRPTETGRGWGSMIGCAACAVATGFIVAGGPATILVAVNTPGSAIALLACAATCYEAFQ
jgi:hypothetical protein